MIDDLSPARPQSGLSSASIVFQAPAEGGIPRYMAIFADSVPTDVGPVRSARYYFIAWASEYKAMYVHAGGSPQALSTLLAQGSGQLVYNADEFRYGPSFRRISTRAAPHNLYTTGSQLRHLAGLLHATAAPKPIWTFNPPSTLSVRPVGGTITFAYPHNTIKYSYDRTTNTYLRTVSVEGAQHDAANKVRIAPTNVIVMWMKFGPLNDGEAYKHRLEATVDRQRPGLDRHERAHDQGHLAQEVDERTDPVLRRQGPPGQPDRRPDLRERPDLGHTGDATRTEPTPRPATAGRSPGQSRQRGSDSGHLVLRRPPGADVGVHDPGGPGDIGPGPPIGTGAGQRLGLQPAPQAVIDPGRRDGGRQPIRVARLDEDPGPRRRSRATPRRRWRSPASRRPGPRSRAARRLR